MSGFDAIQRFLSLTPDERSPMELLNITRDQCDPASIEAALRRRLDRVDKHPQASTPDADTVRMALHAAAALLQDPQVRAQILGEQETDGPRREPTAPAVVRQPITPAQRQAMLAFRRTAIRTILLCRGWNRKSRRMLAAVAGASGLDPESMAVALRSLSGPVASGAPERPAAAPAKKPTIFESLHEPPARAAGAPSGVVMGIGGGIAAAAVLTILVVRMLSPGVTPVDAEPGGSSLAPTEPARTDVRGNASAIDDDAPIEQPRISQQRDSAPANALREPPDPAGLIRTLRRCVEQAKTDPGEAAWRLEQAVSTISSAWTTMEQPTIETAMDAILVFIIEAPEGGERLQRALGAVAAGAKRQASADRLDAFEVAPAVWSCGALAELIASPGVKPSVKEFAGAVLQSAVGEFDGSGAQGFRDGALASLSAMTTPLSVFESDRNALNAWQRWREALLAATRSPDGVVTGDAVVRRELEMLDAVESLMRHGPSLAQRPDVYGEASALLAALRWSPDSASGVATPARLALLRWFDDHSIETEDLALVTEWIVRESDTPGIGIEMTLKRNAGIERRAALRDRYAGVWSLGDGQGADELAVRWTEEAQRMLRRDREPSADIIGLLVRATRISRLNEAAARRWRRENTAATIILRDPYEVVDAAARPAAPAGTLEGAGGRRDGAWATEFLGSNGEEQKFAAVSRLELWGGPVGPIDGDVLARAALLGSPPEVRTAAQRTVRKRADEPAVINGLLESLPVAPKNDSTRALLESVTTTSLPSPRSDAWPRAARLALTERLLEMLAGRSGLSAIDRVSAVLASSYRGRSPDESASARNTATPDAAARLLWSSWRGEAGRLQVAPRGGRSLESLDRRRSGRIALASGPVQRFAAEQSSIAEVMGYVIASERPSRTDEIDAALRVLASERRQASSVFEQIEATERAMLTLWMIRFGEAVPEGALRGEGPA